MLRENDIKNVRKLFNRHHYVMTTAELLEAKLYYYNTPNNTLPIFWSDENSWQPIFQRYNKKYTNSSSVRIGGHYV